MAYVEYISLIDQSFEIGDDEADIPDVDAGDNSEDTLHDQESEFDFFEMFMSFIKYIFEILVSFVTK